MEEVEEVKMMNAEWGFFLDIAEPCCLCFLDQDGAQVAKLTVKLGNLAVLLEVLSYQTDCSS